MPDLLLHVLVRQLFLHVEAAVRVAVGLVGVVLVVVLSVGVAVLQILALAVVRTAGARARALVPPSSPDFPVGGPQVQPTQLDQCTLDRYIPMYSCYGFAAVIDPGSVEEEWCAQLEG